MDSDAFTSNDQHAHARKKSSQCHVLPKEYYYDGSDLPNFGNADSDGNFLRALCIVPPTKDWDRLQRARHYARDPLFHQWPPSIRLFHPFKGTAFDVAEAIEEMDLEPFEITLDTWVIVPNIEALQAEWQNTNAVPDILDASDSTNPYDEEDRMVQELIAREEQVGREKYEARKEKLGAAREVEEYPDTDDKKSPAQMLEEQRRQYEEFGGPCVLCLEPDEDSKQRLLELREEIATILDHDTYSSPSSIYSSGVVNDMDMGYRPLIPISAFESLQGALEIARRLKGLWGEPLKISVKEFHLISCLDDGGKDEWEIATPQLASEWNDEQWMCNAKIMLIGEEMEQDESFNEDMLKKLLEEGEAGGLDISNDFTILDDEEQDIEDIEDWLNLDDDWDEGSQVIIGRTHFFTGEQRTYQGMPASSAVDAKDRSLGDGGGAVSGLARRRRTSTRQGGGWESGEYGRRDSDYLPWTKKERPKRGGPV